MCFVNTGVYTNLLLEYHSGSMNYSSLLSQTIGLSPNKLKNQPKK